MRVHSYNCKTPFVLRRKKKVFDSSNHFALASDPTIAQASIATLPPLNGKAHPAVRSDGHTAAISLLTPM